MLPSCGLSSLSDGIARKPDTPRIPISHTSTALRSVDALIVDALIVGATRLLRLPFKRLGALPTFEACHHMPMMLYNYG